MKRIIGIIALVLAGSLSAMAQTTDNMNRIEVCKQNYHTLFGGEALTGQGTDPEMMDILQKFIFGEVFQTGDLTLKQREMITCITLATEQLASTTESPRRGGTQCGCLSRRTA